MTVQKLLDRLAHVADKSKPVVVVLGDGTRDIEKVGDSFDMLKLDLTGDGRED